jgi:hypothetical protein
MKRRSDLSPRWAAATGSKRSSSSLAAQFEQAGDDWMSLGDAYHGHVQLDHV